MILPMRCVAEPARIFVSRAVVFIAIAVALACVPRPALAQLGAKPSSILIDAASGNVLQADNPDEARFPASLTKMMTLYLTFDALRHQRITLESQVPVSRHAASMQPTKLWLVPGTRITVRQCILGMVTLSANDAAAAMGELLGGSESRFAQLMTQQARALGMNHTVFRNASGLPNPAQVTTARDMAMLARALITTFPEYYNFFSVAGFTFHGRAIYGHDPMLGAYPGADGLKTGYTSAAGFNMATSAVRGGTRLIGIVLGSPNVAVRSAKMVSLLDQGFGRNAARIEVADAGNYVPSPHLIQTASAAELHLTPVALSSNPILQQNSSDSHRAPPKGYSVQVGSFSSHEAALRAVRVTVATVGGVAHVQSVAVHGHQIWRGQVVSLTKAGAYRICPALDRKKGRCFIMNEASAAR